MTISLTQIYAAGLPGGPVICPSKEGDKDIYPAEHGQSSATARPSDLTSFARATNEVRGTPCNKFSALFKSSFGSGVQILSTAGVFASPRPSRLPHYCLHVSFFYSSIILSSFYYPWIYMLISVQHFVVRTVVLTPGGGASFRLKF